MRIKSFEKQVEDMTAWSLVEITWRDAYDAPNGWTETDSYKPEDQIASSIGYFWKNCQVDYITLCATMFNTELPKVHTVGNVTHVPIAMIQSIRVIDKRREKNERIQIRNRQTGTRKPSVVDGKVER
jgi:polyribonucleotide nucleotidyltransferase